MKVIIIIAAILAAASATTLKCQFSKNTVFRYVCEINSAVLAGKAEGITIEHADHLKDLTDADVMMISFVKSTVSVLPNQIFTIFPNLEILDLIEVKMAKWNRDYLKNSKHLKRVWLGQNQLTEITDNSFLGATTLENLVLHSNKIEKIGDKAFNGLMQLKSLELHNNMLTVLNGNVFAPLKKLRELNLGENQIAKIDGNTFSSNSKLEFLNMNDNNITSLRGDIFQALANLTVVYLQNNKIEVISKDILTGCASLMELRLDNNLIKEIPMGIFATNKKFKLLNLMNNPIETFDGKVLPEGMELLYLDETATTVNIPEKLEVYQGEKPTSSHMTEGTEKKKFTTADK